MSVICISRELGAGGGLLGGRVARTLGYGFVDSQIIGWLSTRTGLPADLLAEWDERGPRGFLDRLADNAALSSGLAAAPFVSTVQDDVLADIQRRQAASYVYHEQLPQLLREIGEAGFAVILGRGAGFALRDSCPGLLHVRVIAALERRISAVVERLALEEHQARDIVVKSDEERRKFIRAEYKADINDPTNYHLVVNTGLVGLDTAERLILEAAGKSGRPTAWAGRRGRPEEAVAQVTFE